MSSSRGFRRVFSPMIRRVAEKHSEIVLSSEASLAETFPMLA